MKAEIKYITPEVAHELLKLNTNNRPLSEARVADYARKMIAGKWTENGESIVITDLPRIGSGQHRLHAIIRSQSSYKMVVVTGVSDNSFPTLDTGKSRSGGNVLGCNGVKNATAAAATYHAIDSYRRATPSAFSRNCSPDDIIAMSERYGDVQEFLLLAQKIRKYIGARQSPFAGALYWMNKINRAQMLDFAEKMATGVGLNPGSPELALRRRINDEKKHKTKFPKHEYAALIIVAINAKLRNRALLNCKWNSDHDYPYIGK